MDENYYPTITTEQLFPFTIVQRKLAEDPGFLDDPDCPYGDDVKAFFATFTGDAPRSQDAPQTGLEDVDLEEEASKLYADLQKFGDGLKAGDTAEKSTYFRLSVSLMEKLLQIRERAAGLSQVEQFIREVLTIMEDELPPDNRTRIMHRLRSKVEPAS